ncbi:hypothetical protein GWK48_11245 [Metallosphaera tengchongensis]|uniref:Uncharacterized protein n=1 Tax=Metallosphaera tengchongensis TaxID=1532350 RepID=A0A6N0P0H7_9CREN|nr:hypothetical protein [Metallosphaera tengchongensis]QKR00881.1 hypothetical protein GWK48_11245 [Metallosphaera tengchongensis]
MEISFGERLRWSSTQGRLEVHIVGDKSYSYILVDVGRTTANKSGNP